MTQNQFRIPKQTDQSLVKALVAIREEMRSISPVRVRVQVHYSGPTVDLPDNKKEFDNLDYILSEHSEVMPNLNLTGGNQTALVIIRDGSAITDQVTVDWNWAQQLSGETRSVAFVKLTALARKHLRVSDAEASLVGDKDSAWTRYRDSQQAVVNSLQETAKSMLIDFNKKSLENETALKGRYAKLEEELRAKLKEETDLAAAAHEQRVKALDEREQALNKRQESFNTKEARYVARQEQQNQLTEINSWIQGWSVTPGTSRKRWWVIVAYIFGMLSTAALTWWYSSQNIDLLKAKNFAEIAWWQWTLLSIRSIVPLAAFTTFVIYFIRWSSAWARQHAEEDFRNRARILDIGRSGWLLEAVRDAQDNKRELPEPLLKELSRNLFAHYSSSDADDLHPQAVGDLIMQGLSGLRVKSPDGSEFELTRGKKK